MYKIDSAWSVSYQNGLLPPLTQLLLWLPPLTQHLLCTGSCLCHLASSSGCLKRKLLFYSPSTDGNTESLELKRWAEALRSTRK